MKRWIFDQIHSRNLIYNQCWEDPSLDHEALLIEPADRIVMITSAGCNAMDYLLRQPASIDCVDLNPHQTALMELKLAALRALNHSQFFAMFGKGRIARHRSLYADHLREQLSPVSQKIWDKRIDYFDSEGRGLYFNGTSGLFARALNWHIDNRPGLRRDLEVFQTISSLDRQAGFYRSNIGPKLWTAPLRRVMRMPAVLSLLGVPIDQIRQMSDANGKGVSSLIEERVERMFTTVSIRDNYFWRVYINGCYSMDCCPNYLKAENFQELQRLASRVRLHTMSMSNFLSANSGPFSIFVLLDHMDWLTSRPDLLNEEWRWILERAPEGARIIYRSGGETFDRLPMEVMARLEFAHQRTQALSLRDRVGTYGSFHLARVTAATT